jgi:trimethylamine--corrinoid protein Co-methyltransferase
MLHGFTRNFKALELLSPENVEAVHRATLDVLRETGVRFESPWALDFFEKQGCIVDRDLMRVRFPEFIVEECLRTAPGSFRLKARNPEKDIRVGGNTLYFSCSCGMNTVDLETMEPRPPTKQEHIDLIRVLDSLENCHWLIAYPYFGYAGVPPVMSITEGMAIEALYSTKHQMTAYSMDCEIFNIQIAQALGMEVIGALSASPPLCWSEGAVQHTRRMIDAGFPLGIINGAVYGGSGPATHAGSLVTGNAELISILILIQLLRPGHKAVVNNFSHVMNMTSGSPAFSEIGSSLVQAMFNQMWRYYDVPAGDGGGAMPTSKSMDFQTGYEKAISATLGALSGADIVTLHGSVSSELAMHPLQAILDDDIAGMVGRFLEGEEISPETLAIDLIRQVGPVPGHFLSTEHTRKWYRQQEFIPRAAERMSYPEWMASGKKTALDNARDIMADILVAHKVDPPVTAAQEQDVARILQEAREFYRKKGMITDSEWEAYKEVW